MDFELVKRKLDLIQKHPLGGSHSQFKMAPSERKGLVPDQVTLESTRKAGVLALLYPKLNTTSIVLIQRASYNGVHSAQISFPGGKPEKEDLNLYETSLRETYEEVGIEQGKVQLIRELSQVYIPPSNFLVSPFLGYLDFSPKFSKNHEVDDIFEIQVSKLLDNRNLKTKNMNTSYMENIDVPCFEIDKKIIWGATAMVLSEIKDLLKAI